jgi:hypothetical protein
MNGSAGRAEGRPVGSGARDIILRANKSKTPGRHDRPHAPLTVLAEEATQQKLEKPRRWRCFPVYEDAELAAAEDLAALLTRASSMRGSAGDPRTNTLIIRTFPDRVNASDLISALDKAQPQVEIEAHRPGEQEFPAHPRRAVGFNGRVDPALGNTTALAFPNSGTLAGAQAARLAACRRR